MIKLGLSGPKQLWRHKLWRSRLRKFSTGSKLGETCTPSDTVSDDTIAALAERSPHPLTLADLVRYETSKIRGDVIDVTSKTSSTR